MFQLDLELIMTLNIFKVLIVSSIVIINSAAYANDAPWVGYDIKGKPCRGITPHLGPFDYTKAYLHETELSLVQAAHFNTNVELLLQGAKQKGNMLGDIHYTLKAFPNHHRALNTVINYRLKNGPYTNKGIKQPECYFLRAVNFVPKDDMTIMLYGLYLHRINQLSEAETMYKKALLINPNNIQAMYNYGLLSIDLGNIEQAKSLAKKVYSKGFSLKGLQRKIDAYQ